MKYLMLICANEVEEAKMTPEEGAALMAAYQAYDEAMKAAGVYVDGAPLKPVSTATTVRVRGGKVQATDGPFAETKEQVGGYYLIDAPDLDAALHWAGRCPTAPLGAVEVRPLMPLEELFGTN